jgi:Lipase (class 3)/Wntless-like, transmembrane domain
MTLIHDTNPKLIKLEVLRKRGVVLLLVVNYLTLIICAGLDFAETPLRSSRSSGSGNYEAIGNSSSASSGGTAAVFSLLATQNYSSCRSLLDASGYSSRALTWPSRSKASGFCDNDPPRRILMASGTKSGLPVSSGIFSPVGSPLLPLYSRVRWWSEAGPFTVANRYLVAMVVGLQMNMSKVGPQSPGLRVTSSVGRPPAAALTVVECEASAEGSNDRESWELVPDFLGRLRHRQSLVCNGHPANGTNTSSSHYIPPGGTGICEPTDILALSQLRYAFYRVNLTNFSVNMNSTTTVQFDFRSHNGLFTVVELIITGVLIMITVVFFLYWYIQVVRIHRWENARPEQRWCGWLLVALVLYQNPLFFFEIYRSTDTPSVLAADTLQIFSVAMFLMFWLMMVDVLSRSQTVHSLPLRFYVRKVVFAVLWIAGSVWLAVWLRLSVLSPSLGMPGSAGEVDDPFVAVILFTVSVTVGVLMCALVLIWIGWFIYLLVRTRRTLVMSHMLETRYRQLSFRFLLLLCWSVILYTLVSVAAGAISLSQEGRLAVLLSMQSSSMGRMLLLTVYSYTVVFTLLPPDADVSASCTTGSYDHHVTQFWLGEPETVSVSGKSRFMSELFCLETAVRALELSRSVYSDPPVSMRHPDYSSSGFGDIKPERLQAVSSASLEGFWSNVANDTHAMLVGLGGAASSAAASDSSRRTSVYDNDADANDNSPASSVRSSFTSFRGGSEAAIAFVFRGTVSASNIATDLNAKMATLGDTEHVHKHDTHPHHPRGKHSRHLGGATQVHRGFWEAFYQTGCSEWVLHSLQTRVDELISEAERSHKALTVLCCGHSLGGALATLAAFEVAKFARRETRIPVRIVCYSFGSPRVGNHSFSHLYDELVPRTFRVVNGKDAVTGVPKFLWVFKHVGVEVRRGCGLLSPHSTFSNSRSGFGGFGWELRHRYVSC